MPPEQVLHDQLAALQSFLAVGAVLFGVGLIGFLSRRNMIVMFLSAEMMLQGVSLSLVAWSRYRHDVGGQMLVIFIIAVAACEAAIALALVLMLFERKGNLDIAKWQELRESNQPPFEEEWQPPEDKEEPPQWPHLPPAGVLPESVSEKEFYRRKV
jgi:NADH-quinone oxidoreductase subunit K